jgi:hypothetical protein
MVPFLTPLFFGWTISLTAFHYSFQTKHFPTHCLPGPVTSAASIQNAALQLLGKMNL